MSTTHDDHREALINLIQLRVATPVALAAVRALPWDNEVELAVVRKEDVVAVLLRFLRGDLSATDLEAWANALEGREDIGFEPACDDKVPAFLFETANPKLGAPITPAYAEQWVALLDGNR